MQKTKTMEHKNCRIIAKDVLPSNDTYATQLNNNDLIIGSTGSGKTRGYVIPNILQANESMIVTDTKGNLRYQYSNYLKKKGYRVYDIDLTDAAHSPCGYNPLDFVRYDAATDTYSEADIRKICNTVCNRGIERDPYWSNSAKQYLACLVAYIFECLPKEEHTLKIAGELARIMRTRKFDMLMWELSLNRPDCNAIRMYRDIRENGKVDRTDGCIRMFLSESLHHFTFDGCENFYNNKDKLDFSSVGKRKTAVFLTVSDNNRTHDMLVNLFYMQMLQTLIDTADHMPGNRLPVPVRLILDDFATNTVIPDFDNIISVIRSREIYVSLIIQSLSQLNRLYNDYSMKTIVNNCDHWLYLGGQDVDTAQYLSLKANKTVASILGMGLDDALLFERGQKAQFVEKYDFTKHPDYRRVLSICRTAQNQTAEDPTAESPTAESAAAI